MTLRVDWNVLDDRANVKDRAIELRALVAERIYVAPFLSPEKAQRFMQSPRTAWRWQAMQKASLFLGRPFSGTVLEIGAGTAWCSAMVSRMPTVEKVVALDYDPVSVDKIMPLCFESLGAETRKITRALGSFNATKMDAASVDIVVSIGAIHHSESLPATFAEAFRVIKPGGLFVASEPCEPDCLTNAEQRAKESAAIATEHSRRLYGDDIGEVRESDNSDHNYRLVDYLSTALACGFDAYPYTFDATAPAANGDRFFVDRKCYDGFSKVVLPPYFASGQPALYDQLLLILQKPL